MSWSPWPLTIAVGGSLMAGGFIQYIYGAGYYSALFGLCSLIGALSCWWRDVVREGKWGYHTEHMDKAFTEGFFLFLASEAMFFFSLFWAFFHMSLAPDINIMCVWPPLGVRSFCPWKVPLLGTGVLIASGASIMFAHSSVRNGRAMESIVGTACTLSLGLLFLRLQAHEYYWASFSMTDSVYGSVFFILTGFHGMHVVFGSAYLSVTLFRLIKGDFTRKKHFGFSACAWYWHFVDLVWIFVWASVYAWSS